MLKIRALSYSQYTNSKEITDSLTRLTTEHCEAAVVLLCAYSICAPNSFCLLATTLAFASPANAAFLAFVPIIAH